MSEPLELPDDEDPRSLASESVTSPLAEAVDRMAHQLKNPLQAITVNLEVLRMKAGRGESAEEVDRLTGVVDENVRIVDRRVRMLVALARRSPTEPLTSVDLGEELREARDAFRLDEQEDGLGLEVRLPGTGADLSARARHGGLLALILAGASCAAPGEDGERPYLAAGASGEGPWLEVGPRVGCPGDGGRRELEAQGRRAGGAARGASGEAAGGGPVRIRFPRP